MGWNVSLMIETGAPDPVEVVDCGNYTYNVAPMYYVAFGEHGIRGLDGMSAEAAVPVIEAVIAYMEANADAMKAMNPKNGFGSYEGAMKYLLGILEACRLHTKTMVRVS